MRRFNDASRYSVFNYKLQSNIPKHYKKHKDASNSGLIMDIHRMRQTILIFMLSVFQAHYVLAQGAPAGTQDCSAISNPRDRQRCEETFSQSVKASSR